MHTKKLWVCPCEDIKKTLRFEGIRILLILAFRNQKISMGLDSTSILNVNK